MQDLALLRIRAADHYAHSRDHVEDMLALARKLADKGVAYEKLRSLYFDLSRAPGYGRLSGIDIAKVKVGATVDLSDYEKQNPRDFALFRRCRLSELKRGAFIKSEWGNVRPSWHLQTAAVAMKHLGEGFDIHVSSHDLVFPHHENENAIAEALFGKPLARCWLQSEQVLGDAPAPARSCGHGVFRPRDPVLAAVRALPQAAHVFDRPAGGCPPIAAAAGCLRPLVDARIRGPPVPGGGPVGV